MGLDIDKPIEQPKQPVAQPLEKEKTFDEKTAILQEKLKNMTKVLEGDMKLFGTEKGAAKFSGLEVKNVEGQNVYSMENLGVEATRPTEGVTIFSEVKPVEKKEEGMSEEQEKEMSQVSDYTKKELSQENKDQKYSDGGEIVDEKKTVEGITFTDSVEKGPAEKLPEIQPTEKVESKITEEDIRNMMKKENITSPELFAYMDKAGIPQNNPDGSRKLWSEFTVDEQYAITQGVLEGRKQVEVPKIEGMQIIESVEKKEAGLPEVEEGQPQKIDMTEMKEMNLAQRKIEAAKKSEEIVHNLSMPGTKVEGVEEKKQEVKEKEQPIVTEKPQANVPVETDKKEITQEQIKKLVSDPKEIPPDVKFEGPYWTDQWKMSVYNYMVENNINPSDWNGMNPDQKNEVVNKIIAQQKAPASGQVNAVSEVGQKYYDNKGNEISKEQYEASRQEIKQQQQQFNQGVQQDVEGVLN